ncbi:MULTISPECIES: helix-turn-helix transcriptional regulator [Rhodopseudomonas]|uniref:ArsR family transcriptional regulator n=1 Tax=Rhodopseudomonas palustris TaxID=1076 RepID=A0A0D7EFQ2_RHOPL|nr:MULTISPECIES: helix-turn-helix transcriptional regulator [Rhodopseudomonas]KIZ39568.1 ArsR family transcriptional regulator [Rhodopseudomonas palustris]MDF3810441.1 helix-turn-helix transcriptional regulator [Rhodopseudomonas sp. BAL398]WOK19579.1 helix-turn-helix transcriptional regulator [Rhodopseudomonas sp. BAL398]
MPSHAMFAEIAALSGDPARAHMLHALMDGRALTATELAKAAGITPQTASGHLSRMTSIGLLSVEQQGRHRYHRLATASVARMLESIMQVAAYLAPVRARLAVGPRDAALRKARTCYDHLAGRLGVALSDAMIARGHVELTGDAGVLTEAGLDFLGGVGLDIAPMLARRTRHSGRVLCRPCLDWSERRPHLAGALGAAICAHSLGQGWTRRLDGTRAVQITPKGERIFRESFGARI